MDAPFLFGDKNEIIEEKQVQSFFLLLEFVQETGVR